MNEYKFSFIICTNNELYLSECMHYINNLDVPEGYEIDVLTVHDAVCMTKGYNEGMQASDAKYKIYMHQDVFILNRHILYDLLEVFSADEEIGMIGMVGYEHVSDNAIMWHERRLGAIYSNNGVYPTLDSYRYSCKDDGFFYAAEVDGLLIATCCDIEWDTEHLDGWDFYDAFQSMRFLRGGKKIAVPVQRYPWCMHDDNVILNMFNYDKYRQIFIKLYGEYLGLHWKEIILHNDRKL